MSGLLLRGAGLAAAVWAGAAFWAVPDLGRTREFGDKVSRGYAYPFPMLKDEARKGATRAAIACQPHHSVSVLQIAARTAETAIETGALLDIDPALDLVRSSAIRTLGCSPTQTFAWLALYWVGLVQTGPSVELDALLAESYRTGPYESWIESRRSLLAMTRYENLSPPLQAAALDEFMRLIDRYETDVAVEIFKRTSDATRALVRARVDASPAADRSQFTRMLNRSGFAFERSAPPRTGTPPRLWIDK